MDRITIYHPVQRKITNLFDKIFIKTIQAENHNLTDLTQTQENSSIK